MTYLSGSSDVRITIYKPSVAPLGNAVPPKRSPAHYLWAVLIARFLRPCGTDRS